MLAFHHGIESRFGGVAAAEMEALTGLLNPLQAERGSSASSQVAGSESSAQVWEFSSLGNSRHSPAQIIIVTELS